MKPILFSTPMVQAILDGRKTMTRRVVKRKGYDERIHAPQNDFAQNFYENLWLFGERWDNRIAPQRSTGARSPYQPGDILWVRETWYYEEHLHDLTAGEPDLPGGRYSHRYIHRASQPDYPVDIGVGQHGWHPSIFMPREAARIFLRVTDVRVERLQEMPYEDIEREGFYVDQVTYTTGDDQMRRDYKRSLRTSFTRLWDSLNAKRGYGWDKNPFVWVIELERIDKADLRAAMERGTHDAVL
jgi:hypothetical protein